MVIKVDLRQKGSMYLANMLRTFAIAIIFSSVAYAADPTSSTLGFTARNFNRTKTLMRLNFKNTFDVAGDRTCTVKLYYSLSTVGELTAGRVRKVASRKVKARRRYARFIAITTPIDFIQGLLQTQLNVQTLTTCGSTSFVSNAVAENVTSEGGKSRSIFVRTFKKRLAPKSRNRR